MSALNLLVAICVLLIVTGVAVKYGVTFTVAEHRIEAFFGG